jgi:hypothetical protein
MEETDMCVNPTQSSPFRQQQFGALCSAKSLAPTQRQELAFEALAGGLTVTHLAEEYQVSRKFVYQQTAKAQQALDEAFAPPGPADDEVLFYLPVTRAWLKQLMLALTLLCHSSFRGVVELLRDLFDFPVSIGTVHNVVRAAVTHARRHNERQDLSRVCIGAHDEIYQAQRPVLVGADVASTYCYLLSQEEHCDADTWGVRLLELRDRNFQPDATIADAGGALRAGQAQALPDTPCRGDVFHLLQPAGELVGYLRRRALKAIAARTDLERKLARARRPQKHQRSAPRRHDRQRKQNRLACRLASARQHEDRAVALADEVALLVAWLRDDILAVAGPDYSTRQVLYDFVVAELKARTPGCPHRIEPLVIHLEKQRDDVLAFARVLDAELAVLAEKFQVPLDVPRELLQIEALDPRRPTRWQRQATFRQRLGHDRFRRLQKAVADLLRHTVRASSVIENLNSRLRSYFFLRRQLGPDYLALLQFFLNHRRFLRSEHPDRVGKSPAELLTGQAHPHWLEMLGYQRFSRN